VKSHDLDQTLCFQFDLTSLDRKLITSDRRSRYTADVFNIMSFQIAYTNTEGAVPVVSLVHFLAVPIA
jgi:hypothetical protein